MGRKRAGAGPRREQAEYAGEYGGRAGADFSARLAAASRQPTGTGAAQARSSHVDVVIAAARRRAAELPALPEPTDADLTDTERWEMAEILGLGHGGSGRPDRGRPDGLTPSA
ncbi:hypothetical protein CUT44_16060 [Streptomyces carminius]|uniref:Uncharacterized protein n=1 Tax=Streptomyces carminius TaxID=2665496 RepID=A0A2M8LXX8_9ACTN|nr:hypothetical protein [Streptomyces carminius]PJE96827.1 hypothetical protein CUT44_16060 [Streptomyces carminius]